MITDTKKILVTGIAGFLGSNLLGKLLANGHQVVGIDNLSFGTLENIAPHLDHSNFVFLQKDMMEMATFESLEKDFDVIIHLAAYKIPRYGKAVDTLKINSKGCEHVLDFARSFFLQSCSCLYLRCIWNESGSAFCRGRKLCVGRF